MVTAVTCIFYIYTLVPVIGTRVYAGTNFKFKVRSFDFEITQRKKLYNIKTGKTSWS